jgi:hypothetical protein
VRRLPNSRLASQSPYPHKPQSKAEGSRRNRYTSFRVRRTRSGRLCHARLSRLWRHVQRRPIKPSNLASARNRGFRPSGGRRSCRQRRRNKPCPAADSEDVSQTPVRPQNRWMSVGTSPTVMPCRAMARRLLPRCSDRRSFDIPSATVPHHPRLGINSKPASKAESGLEDAGHSGRDGARVHQELSRRAGESHFEIP